eukprot:4557528-Pleurochrysis_carterae.AAC.1
MLYGLPTEALLLIFGYHSRASADLVPMRMHVRPQDLSAALCAAVGQEVWYVTCVAARSRYDIPSRRRPAMPRCMRWR